MTSPWAVDLCCGKGGWTAALMARGYRVVGFDTIRFPDYPGELVIQDVRTIEGRNLRGASLIVASPPCQEFSRWRMPWTRAKNPPDPAASEPGHKFLVCRDSGYGGVAGAHEGCLQMVCPLPRRASDRGL